MVTKLKIIALIVLLVIGIAGCIGEKRGTPTKPVPTGIASEYKVEYWPLTHDEKAYLMIVVRGDPERYGEIHLLVDGKESSLGGILSEADSESIIDFYMFAVGTYGDINTQIHKVSIVDTCSGKTVHAEEISVTGGLVFVRNVEFEVQESDDIYMIPTITLHVTNKGDTIIRITKAMIWIDWYDVGGRPGESPIAIYHNKKMEISLSLELQPGESRILIKDISLPSMDAGTYDVMLTLYTYQRLIARYDIELVLE